TRCIELQNFVGPRWVVSPAALHVCPGRLAQVDHRRGPARTVYALTDAGRQEFIACRDQALREMLRSDPIDLALHYANDVAEDELAALIADRRATLAARLAERRHQRERAAPYLRGIAPMLVVPTHT